MVSDETAEPPPPPPSCGPRISFSADLSSSDSDGEFICINPKNLKTEKDNRTSVIKATDFEFLSNTQTMLSPDELFSDGKLLPFWQINHFSDKLQNITLKTKPDKQEDKVVREEKEDKVVREDIVNNNNNRGSWFLDDDPSPRPPKCTVLWKELLRLKKQRTNNTTISSTRASSLSPSSSSSSTSSSSSSIGDAVKKEESEGKRGKKVLERTRSVTMRIRPIIHVPVVTPSKSSASLPPLFPLKFHKNRVERQI
ncbi:unnamed protein product [Cochlearia groenlandica]